MEMGLSSSKLRSQSLNALVCLLVWLPLASTFASDARRRDQESWRPARKTGDANNADRIGWSPKPTEAPRARYEGMELFKRYTMGSNTCGFVSGYSSAAITCVKFGAYCTNDGVADMDCCDSGLAYEDCTSSMYSTCVDHSASAQGACSNPGPRTVCCPSSLPSCYTFLFSTSTSPGKLFSVLQCQETGGIGTLLGEPPALAATGSSLSSRPSSTSLTSQTMTTSTTSPSSNSNLDSSNSTPIGAIVGGVIGGLAIIGIVVVLVVYILRQKKNGQTKSPPQTAQATLYPSESKYPYGTPEHPAEAPANAGSYFGQGSYAQSTTSPGQTLASPGTVSSTDGGYAAASPVSLLTPGSQPLPSELPVREAPGSRYNRAELSQ